MNPEKQFTRKEFIEAIRKNGYTQAHHALFRINEGKFEACALGQGLINVGVVDYEEDIVPVLEKHAGESLTFEPLLNSFDFIGDFYDIIAKNCGREFPHRVYLMNDDLGLSCAEIAEKLDE